VLPRMTGRGTELLPIVAAALNQFCRGRSRAVLPVVDQTGLASMIVITVSCCFLAGGSITRFRWWAPVWRGRRPRGLLSLFLSSDRFASWAVDRLAGRSRSVSTRPARRPAARSRRSTGSLADNAVNQVRFMRRRHRRALPLTALVLGDEIHGRGTDVRQGKAHSRWSSPTQTGGHFWSGPKESRARYARVLWPATASDGQPRRRLSAGHAAARQTDEILVDPAPNQFGYSQL
jgi:hypothetical protein